MGRYSKAAVLGIAAAAAVLGVGCSSADEGVEQTQSAQTTSTSTSELPPLPPQQTPPEAVGVSPGGVTTRVDVDSDATESQYGQACLAAKAWMDSQGGDPTTLVEPYLRTLQEPGFVGPGNFDTEWTKLTPAQQAGVIMAANGAANGECA